MSSVCKAPTYCRRLERRSGVITSHVAMHSLRTNVVLSEEARSMIGA